MFACYISSRFAQFVVCNSCQSSPPLTILVPLWFIIISLVFFILVNYYFQVSFNLKGNFECSNRDLARTVVDYQKHKAIKHTTFDVKTV